MTHDRMLVRLAARDPVAIEWAVQNALNYIANGGELGFEACCRLSATTAARRRAMRDHYIAEVAAALGAGEAVAQTALHAAFARFQLERWPAWKHYRTAPGDASPADRFMFAAFKAGRVPNTPQGLGKIVRKQIGN